MSHNILSELDGLIKTASAKKQAALAKEAQDGGISAKLDNAEDGTSPATTGEQAADMHAAQKETYSEGAVDNNADDSEAGESVDMSSDEATAVATDGQEGTEGGELESQGNGVSEADNGPTMGDTPKPDGWNSGSFKEAAAALRKQASELEKAAEDLLTPLDKFLVKSARASGNEGIRKQAEAMADDELADAAADSLMGQIEGGELSEEEAGAILEEALQSGAISEEDVAEAVQAVEGEAAAMGAPEEEVAMAEEEVPAEGGMPEMTDEQMMEAKIAAAEIGPDDPRYIEKLAAFYPAEINAGYTYAMKLAEEMASEEDSDDSDMPEEVEEKKEDMEDDGELNDSNKKEAEEAEVEEESEEVDEGETDGDDGDTPTEGEDEGEEADGEDDEMPEEFGEEMEMIAPSSPDEEAALAAVQEELGMDDPALQQLMTAPVAPEAKMAMAKTASAMKAGGIDYAMRVRTTILNKVAALRR